MCIFTWTAPVRNLHFINGDITSVSTSNYTFKCDLQTRFQQLVNSKGKQARVISRHGTQLFDGLCYRVTCIGV